MEAPALSFKEALAQTETPALLAGAWSTEKNPMVRKIVTDILQTRRADPEHPQGGGIIAWPSAEMRSREEMAALYPDPDDPQFAARLFSKREFYEARAVAAQVSEGTLDPCSSGAAQRVFELTPVQRIVSRFLNPLTPYMGMLLFHGVGVGKTYSAVSVAEQFLEAAPTKKVIVLVPQALKDNFKKTIFDVNKLIWSPAEGAWTSNQLAGTATLERLGLLRTNDIKLIEYKTDEDRRSRYTITGYKAFANWIERALAAEVPSSLTDPAARKAAENEVLRRLFSDHLIIVDEAHNLRDKVASATVGTEAGGAREEDVGDSESPAGGEAAENAGGKALNPFLKRIVLNAEGLRLVFMTATPMYDAAPEILLLLDYLLMNDFKTESVRLPRLDLFTKTGQLRSGPAVRRLEDACRRYVSYMRGENPFTFPLRMRPVIAADDAGAQWPDISATKKPVLLTEQEAEAISAMPLVFTDPVPGSPPERALRLATKAAEAEEGDTSKIEAMLDFRIQMANITYPNDQYGSDGWTSHFEAQRVVIGKRKLRQFRMKPMEAGITVDSIFGPEGLATHAPKMARIVESVKKAQGICFAYSRYITAGALPLAVALERAGFQRRLPDGQIVNLLMDAPPVAPICAFCGLRAAEHPAAPVPGGQEHPFRPACYILLTSESDISPDFKGAVQLASAWSSDPEWGPLGGTVKVVIGSQVASEGLDLKCIREMHILDPWYHFNRIEQIIGRAIRYCSHTALRPVEKRLGLPPMSMSNCLIYLHALRIPDVGGGGAGAGAEGVGGLRGFETADMYAYRLAIGKALRVGEVQRLMKKHAWDCNLELEAIVFTGLPKRHQVDAQGRVLEDYSIDDKDFTTYCDYQTCRHECAIAAPRTPEDGLALETSTFSVSDARKIILGKQEAVRRLFTDQTMVPEGVVQELFEDLPWEISSEALLELIDGRRFRIRRPDGVDGYLIKKAGYLIFQPLGMRQGDIPMSLRYARAYQLQRRFMIPELPVLTRGEEGVAAPVLAAPEEGAGGAGAPAAGAGRPSPAAALGLWAEWNRFVRFGTPETVPAWLPTAQRIWIWILNHFAPIPEIKTVARRWWFERMTTYDQRRVLYEYALDEAGGGGAGGASADMEDLAAILKRDVLRSSQLFAYRIFNPETLTVEHFCRTPAAGEYSACPSIQTKTVDRLLGDKPIQIVEGPGAPAQGGTLIGFIAAKTGGRLVFKTLDTTKEQKHSSVGAECYGVSNLGEHHPRIRLLHAAGRAVPDLAPFMLSDGDADHDAAGAKKRMATLKPTHMKDISHPPLCLYMEALCRLFDERKVLGLRWFLSAEEVPRATMKKQKGKK